MRVHKYQESAAHAAMGIWQRRIQTTEKLQDEYYSDQMTVEAQKFPWPFAFFKGNSLANKPKIYTEKLKTECEEARTSQVP